MINILKHLHLSITSFQNNIIFLDIDNTLLIPQNIFIYSNNISYTPEEYAKLNIKQEDKINYDYSDFRDHDIIKNSILTSIPLEDNLKDIDNFVAEGFELGILTARGQENLIARIIPKWLKRKVKNKFPRIKRDNIHGISDQYIKYEGKTDGEKKLNVLIKHVESGKYDNVFLIDDNIYTIETIRKYNKKVRKNKRIQLIIAK